MHTDEPGETNDPWSDLARELSGDTEPADLPSTPSEQSDDSYSGDESIKGGDARGSDEETTEPAEAILEDAERADDEGAAELNSDAPAEDGVTAESAPAAGSADWNFLAKELGLEVADEGPVAEANPAAELFADYTPSYIEEEDEEETCDGQADDLDAEDDDGSGDPLVASPELEVESGDVDGNAEEAKSVKKPRRRGRRRWLRRKDSDADEEEQATASASETDSKGESAEEDTSSGEETKDDPEKPPRRRRGRRRGKRGGSDKNDSEVNDEGEAVPAEADEAGEKVTASEETMASTTRHRKIPTWPEAISVLVESNLQSRGKQVRTKGGNAKKDSPKKGRGRTRKPKTSR